MTPGPDDRRPRSPRTDGDGWARCDAGHRHWGRFGAAGVLPVRDVGRGVEVLLQHRAPWTHEGDTWSVVGGARAARETAGRAAAREAVEEAALDPRLLAATAEVVLDHGGWTYTTVVAWVGGTGAGRPDARGAGPGHAGADPEAGDNRDGRTDDPGTDGAGTGGPASAGSALGGAPVDPHHAHRPTAADDESTALAWVALADVAALPLHAGFAATWPLLRSVATARLDLVVDVANVMGARPDGWWRDRAGAARRLVEELRATPADLALLGLDPVEALAGAAARAGTGTAPHPGLRLTLLPQVTAVVEGAARSVAWRTPASAGASGRRAATPSGGPGRPGHARPRPVVTGGYPRPGAAAGSPDGAGAPPGSTSPALLPDLRTVAAPGHGDDEIVHQVRVAAEAATPPAALVVATSDALLAQRCRDAGATHVVGAGRLLRAIGGASPRQ